MPLVYSSYRPPRWLSNRHIQTIFPARLRKPVFASFFRENVLLADGDTLQLDWASAGRIKLAVILAGVVSNNQTAYVHGMIQRLAKEGYDSVYCHYRGSHIPNPNPRFYHAGCWDDLDLILTHILETTPYLELVLIGFSMGGNVVLKYLGEKGTDIPDRLKKAMAISAPCDLRECTTLLDHRKNLLYRHNFLSQIKNRLARKKKTYPAHFQNIDIEKIRTIKEFESQAIVPLNGFNSLNHYYDTCSSKPGVSKIQIPTLILNAKDDPILGENCHPIQECAQSPYVTLELCEYGGHTGFMYRVQGPYYSEERAAQFICLDT